MDLENISRRSFLKKTTVLTVGVASVTLFSGLVMASDVGGYNGYQYACYNPEIGDNYLATQVYGTGQNQCWQSATCGGEEYVVATWECPDPSAGESAYNDWLNNCASLEARSMDKPICLPISSDW